MTGKYLSANKPYLGYSTGISKLKFPDYAVSTGFDFGIFQK